MIATFSRVRVLLLLFLACAGCGPPPEAAPARRPRPVTVAALTASLPPSDHMVTASVGSWKTEEIGFEVEGRIESVAEPNTEIEGRVVDESGATITEGDVIARVDDERYRLRVEKATVDVMRARQALAAAETEYMASIPAQIAAAEAVLKLAKTEYNRSVRLFEQRAGAEGDVDRTKADLESSSAQLKQLEASLEAKKAEVASLENAVLQSEQDLRDAQRELNNCTLFSSFRGQISEVSVVPGSVVSPGQPVVTIQMMDPIKVELEVSTEDSRRLQQAGRLPVFAPMPEGPPLELEGYLYLIDPTADPLTRTFTVTLLVMNRKLAADDESGLPTTDIRWRLDFKFLPGSEDGMLFVDETAVLEDDEGPYLWKIENASAESGLPADRILHVTKLRIRRGPLKVPYLGNWVFQQVILDEDADFDPAANVVAGELVVPDGEAADWDGDRILFDAGSQWMLRPGDLVRVDLAGDTQQQGYYVPMQAIVREDDVASIFVVSGDAAEPTVRRVDVRMLDDATRSLSSTLRRVEAVDGQPLEGLSYVVKGAHYLVNGEPVRVVTPLTSSSDR